MGERRASSILRSEADISGAFEYQIPVQAESKLCVRVPPGWLAAQRRNLFSTGIIGHFRTPNEFPREDGRADPSCGGLDRWVWKLMFVYT